ncbi:VanZ family protein [Paenibacillus dokdonensis]|uniref:VanZ family protein n=1 Tax=Paenibacillus dokdonensis TaxID=2567944 RepID=UPI0010A82CBA|nr:VanZ family protein [Paenibacillus dokdonensis]
METKLRKIIFAGIILYTFLILYFLFFAFNRLDHEYSEYGYDFMLIPESVPILFPNLSDLSFSWIFNLGNIAAFIPYGIVIPLLYRTHLVKFISVFVLTILVLETLQSLTFLGTFDVDDVISNTLGAGIGFCAYKVGLTIKVFWKKLMAMGLTIVVLLVGIMGISEIINYAVEKREGPVHALNEVKEITGSMPMTKDLPGFTVAGKKIEPKMNLYSSEGQDTKKYTYILGEKKDILFYSSFGIPDNGDDHGELIIAVDGKEIVQYNEQYYQDMETIDFSMNSVHEITITLKGNAKLWDVKFSEMKHWWE